MDKKSAKWVNGIFMRLMGEKFKRWVGEKCLSIDAQLCLSTDIH